MFTIFDILSLVLLIVSMALFVKRYLKQNPPVYPYLIIACTCWVANWLGESGGGLFALVLLIAAGFSFLGCLLYPSWRTMTDTDSKKPSTAEEAPAK